MEEQSAMEGVSGIVPSRRRRLARLLAGPLVAAGFAGCVSWERTLEDTVEPINRLLHHELREALKAGEVQRLEDLCVEAERPRMRAAAAELAAEFARVENVDCVIEALAPVAGGAMAATMSICLEGLGHDGLKLAIEEEGRYVCARAGASSWRIAARQIAARRKAVQEGPIFAEEAAPRGLRFRHRSRGILDRFGHKRDHLAGSGLAARDVDRDGHDDLLLVGGGELRLFLFKDGGFRDASAAYGVVAPPKGECRCAIFADYDNDGDADFFLGVVDGPNWIYRLEGGRYEAIEADRLGATSLRETTGACFGDFDADGFVDLFVVNGGNLLWKKPEPIYHAKNAAPDQLFRNRGDGSFEDVTERAGVGDGGWGLGCQSGDFDADGDLDLYVANDFSHDVLYFNRGDGTFADVTFRNGTDRRDSSMGISAGDADGDGDLDLFVSAMFANSAWMIDQTGFPVPAPWPISFLLRRHILDIMHGMFDGNRLYLNQGDGSFREAAQASGVRNSGWAWGGIFLDYDNDADLDLYVLNGFVSGKQRKDL